MQFTAPLASLSLASTVHEPVDVSGRVPSQSPQFAFPTLVGEPAYGRPRPGDDREDRRVSVDDLPLEQFRTDEDRRLAEHLAAPPNGSLLNAQRSDPSAARDPSPPSNHASPRGILARFLLRGSS